MGRSEIACSDFVVPFLVKVLFCEVAVMALHPFLNLGGFWGLFQVCFQKLARGHEVHRLNPTVAENSNELLLRLIQLCLRCRLAAVASACP